MANKISNIGKVEKYMKKKYPNAKFNIISETVDFGVKGIIFEDVYIDIKQNNINISVKDLQLFFRSNKTPKFDPFKAYFDQLTYDGVTDYIKELAAHVHTDNPQFFYAMFKKHLVRIVGQAIGDKEFVNRFVIVLRSTKENLGKSTFIRFLEPFNHYYYTENLGDKRQLAMTRHFIYNIEELESFNDRDLNTTKDLISSSTYSLRVIYTDSYARKKRRCSLFASTNEENFLGKGDNSRWLVFNINRIDFSYNNTKNKTKKINIDDVWAQAYHLFKTNYDYDLTPNEWKKAKSSNKNHVFKNDVDTYVTEHLKCDENAFASSTQIALYFKLCFGKNFSSISVGKAMIAAGYKKISKGSSYGYTVVTTQNTGVEGTNIEIKRIKNGS